MAIKMLRVLKRTTCIKLHLQCNHFALFTLVQQIHNGFISTFNISLLSGRFYSLDDLFVIFAYYCVVALQQ